MLPLWGYDRKFRPNALATGTRDPLYAKALALEAGGRRLVVISLDLGRAPSVDITAAVRDTLRTRCGVDALLLCASHTHHAPVLELRNAPGQGQGTFDEALSYYAQLQEILVDAAAEAIARLEPARIGWGTASSMLNRNRLVPGRPEPCDRTLLVLRVDRLDGAPLARVVNFAAHATLYPPHKTVYSAEYPGVMAASVEQATGALCLFVQGASGDLQFDIDDARWGLDDFIEDVGARLADEVLALDATIRPSVPSRPSLCMRAMDLAFDSRIDFSNTALIERLGEAFFPELVRAIAHGFSDNVVRPHIEALVLNGELGIVGFSGEFFCANALRLRAQMAGLPLLFAGYCNGHDMYFPSLDAMAEGGYGAEPEEAWAVPGAAEIIADSAADALNACLREAQTP